MTATEQFAESANLDPSAQARLLDPAFAPTNYDEYTRALKLIQNQNESCNTTKTDDVAEYIEMGSPPQGRDFKVTEGAVKYTVEEGDNLWSIVNEALTKKEGQAPAAWKTLETLRKIAEKNQLSNPDLIHAGDVIDFSVIAENEDNRGEQRPPINTTDGAQTVPLRSDSNDTEDRPEAPTDANQAGSSGRRPRDNWYISQAADRNTGDYFACGPTSLLMALADQGLAESTEANRQKLIRETGTDTGRIFPGGSEMMANEAKRRGLNSEFKNTTDWREVNAQIEKGRAVIVNGTTASGYKHFVYISGKDASGNYIMGDPAQPDTKTWSPGDLKNFMSRQEPNGYVAVWR